MPVAVSGLASGVTAIAGGWEYTCALAAGAVKCWGYNGDGELGDGTTTNRSVPVAAIGLSGGISAVVAGSYHTCALTAGGAVRCWGYNDYGEVGDGTTTNHSSPVAVSGLTSGVNAIAAGSYHTCAVSAGGSVSCWGYNGYGQLGDGANIDSATPVPVSNLASGAAAITAGFYHTCALLAGGKLKCWGRNDYGQVGDGTTTDHAAPAAAGGLTSGIKALAAGYYHTCVLTTSGGVECWGYNTSGQLGDGTTTDRYTPVGVVGLGNGVAAIALGGYHTCALTTGGAVECWGDNEYGQLGDGTTTSSDTPVPVSGLASGVTAITAGDGQTCALLAGGAVKCWGRNDYGQLGDGATANLSTPVAVTGLASGVAAIAGGGYHTCALTVSGAVECWGGNEDGQLGDGTTTDHHTPVAVTGLASGVTAISTHGWFTCALVTGQGVECWGDNSYGQMGDGTTTERNVPVPVKGLANGVTAISAGGWHTCALTAGGGLECWGLNTSGELGDGTYTSATIPVDVQGLASRVSIVTAGKQHTCALAAGSVMCWGYNWDAELGINPDWTPVDVIGFGRYLDYLPCVVE